MQIARTASCLLVKGRVITCVGHCSADAQKFAACLQLPHEYSNAGLALMHLSLGQWSFSGTTWTQLSATWVGSP